MKVHLAIGLAATGLALPSTALAQDDQSRRSGVARAVVAEPLQVTATQPLSFGILSVANGQSGEVVVDSAGLEPRLSSSINPVCADVGACRIRPAEFAVSGENNRVFGVDLPQPVALSGSSTGASLQVRDFTVGRAMDAENAAVGRFDEAGTANFSVGATLDIPADTRPDAYRGEFTVSVFYY